MLKVLSWNIRQGGGSRVSSICQKLINSDSQLIVLSEFRNNSAGASIRHKLLLAGYRHQYVSNSKPSENSAAVFSKIKGSSFSLPIVDSKYHENMVGVSFAAFDIIGVYLPHKKKHQLFDSILQQTSKEVCKPRIICGDFNTGFNFIDQAGDSFWYTDKMKALGDASYVDAFRLIHADKKEFSWFSHQGNGYRYDHTYIHSDISPLVSNCYYLHEWREEKLSDHSPMILELKG